MKKYTLYFLSLILTFSCSKEESNSNKQESETFLQRVNGIGFVDSNDGDEYYFFFNSAQFIKNVIVVGQSQYSYCSTWSEGTIVVEDETVEIEILSNTYESLLVEFRSDYQGDSSGVSFEFRLNETETILTRIYNGDENDSSIWRKTGEKVSDFKCDESIGD